MQKFSSFPIWLAMVIVVSLGCKPERDTVDLLVAVRTDYQAGAEFEQLEVRVSGSSEVVLMPACRSGTCTSFDQARLVATFEALAPEPSRRVQVRLLAADGSAVASDVGIVDHQQRSAMVLWITRSCGELSCGKDQRCLGLTCVDARCTDGTQSQCSADESACQQDEDCPAVACGTPRCERSVCVPQVVSGSCPGGQVCVPELGCSDEEEPAPPDDEGIEVPAEQDGGTPQGDAENRFPKLAPEVSGYVSMTGVNYTLYAWIGNEVALLTTTNGLDPEVMGRILTVYDDVYSFYEQRNSRTPAPFRTLAGRAVIAFLPALPAECPGGVCFSVGESGLELLESDLATLYLGVRDEDRFDTALLELLALSFWFYEPQVGFPNSDVVAFGFSVCSALDGLLSVQPSVMQRSGQDLRAYRMLMQGFVDTYVDLGAPWASTLGVGGAPANNNQLTGADLLCSMLQRLSSRHGETYDQELWQQVGALPSSSSTLASASDGLLVAASRAARADLTPVIVDLWGFPASTAARNLAKSAGPPVNPADY